MDERGKVVGLPLSGFIFTVGNCGTDAKIYFRSYSYLLLDT